MNSFKKKNEKLKINNGFPLPFGASRRSKGINFAVFSKHAKSIKICLFHPNEIEPQYEIELNPENNKTGNVWHILIENIDPSFHYGFRVDGPIDEKLGLRFNKCCILLDPYAKAIASNSKWRKKNRIYNRPLYQRGVILVDNDNFDWKGELRPNIPLKDLIIYEMHVRGFTQDPSSKVKNRGSFNGIVEKIPYLKKLGINCIELLPIHEFNELEFPRKNPSTNETLVNYWGYSTINFFSPMNRYSSGKNPIETILELKSMIKELHKNGIEVILDVVFNHTAEGNEKGPHLSFRGFENNTYYMLTKNGEYLNFSGCGNTMNCNHPIVRELIHNSLRYWVTEMHIDGFRFDLASILGRSTDGTPLSNPPLLEQIALDPIFAKTKLIAEAWDAAGLYQVGSFPSWGIWAEWNGQFRDAVRRFIKGTPYTKCAFATRICGSEDLYGNGRSPSHSINFITSHDGFTLKDLVSFNIKHNKGNAENNRDGENNNESWNCGIEGKTSDKKVLEIRDRQLRNLHMALMISQGVPMLHMGDEYGHSKNGNNNTWCQDNKLNWFSWKEKEASKNKGFFRFYKNLIYFRHRCKILKRSTFLKNEDIDWHGTEPYKPNWESKVPFIAFTLNDLEEGQDLYIAFNANYKKCKVVLPKGRGNKKWHRIIYTALKSPRDFLTEGHERLISKNTFKLSPYSAILLILI